MPDLPVSLNRWLMGLACLLLAACAAPGGSGTGVEVIARGTPTGASAESGFRLRVSGERPAERQLLTLPTAPWTTAEVVFESATALAQQAVLAIPRANMVDNSASATPNFEFVGTSSSTPAMPLLRPASDYNLKVNLYSNYDTASEFLQAYGSLTGQTLNAGSNLFEIPVTPTGNVGGEIPIHVGAGSQTGPLVAYDSKNKRFLVVYNDDGDIRGRLYDLNGVLIRGQKINTTNGALKPCGNPDLVYMPNSGTAGRFVIVWQDQRDGDWDVYARTWDCADHTMGLEELIAGHNGSNQVNPTIAADNEAARNHILVAWTDTRNAAATGNDIYGRMGLVNGANINTSYSTAAFVICDKDRNQGDAKACFMPYDNRFLIMFSCYELNDDWDIRYNRVHTSYFDNANPQTADPTSPGRDFAGENGSNQQQPYLVYNSTNKDVMVVFRDDRDDVGVDYNIYFKIYHSETDTFNFWASRLFTSAYDQDYPSVAYSSKEKKYMVAYSDKRRAADAPYRDLYYRRVGADGTRSTTEKGQDEKFVVQKVRDQYRSSIVHVPDYVTPSGNVGAYLIVWEDHRDPNAADVPDIYGQFVF